MKGRGLVYGIDLYCGGWPEHPGDWKFCFEKQWLYDNGFWMCERFLPSVGGKSSGLYFAGHYASRWGWSGDTEKDIDFHVIIIYLSFLSRFQCFICFCRIIIALKQLIV